MRLEEDFEALSPSRRALRLTPPHSSASDVITIDASVVEIKSHHPPYWFAYSKESTSSLPTIIGLFAFMDLILYV